MMLDDMQSHNGRLSKPSKRILWKGALGLLLFGSGWLLYTSNLFSTILVSSQPLSPQTPREKPLVDIGEVTQPVLPEDIYDHIAPAVVYIETKNKMGDPYCRGSGFFIDEALLPIRYTRLSRHHENAKLRTTHGLATQIGYIVTNHRAIENAALVDIELQNGDVGVLTEVIASDADLDLALLAVMVTTNNPLQTINFAVSDPRVLSTVYAIGSPRGLKNSASVGEVNGYREFKPGVRWLQTTAPVSPGSSGSPLLSPDGKLTGVITLWQRDAQNLNLAVPVSVVRKFLTTAHHHRTPDNQKVAMAIPQELPLLVPPAPAPGLTPEERKAALEARWRAERIEADRRAALSREMILREMQLDQAAKREAMIERNKPRPLNVFTGPSVFVD